MVVVILKLQFDVYEFVRAMQFTRKRKTNEALGAVSGLKFFLMGGTSQTGKNGLGK